MLINELVAALFKEFDETMPGGSPEAAAAQPAHDVLVTLKCERGCDLRSRASQLGPRPSGFTRKGAAVGASVTKEILACRQNDGWIVHPLRRTSSPSFRAAGSRLPA